MTLRCWGFTGCLGMHREMLPQESEVGTQLITAMWETALFLRLREPSIYPFCPTQLPPPIIIINAFSWNIELKIKALGDFNKCKYSDCLLFELIF